MSHPLLTPTPPPPPKQRSELLVRQHMRQHAAQTRSPQLVRLPHPWTCHLRFTAHHTCHLQLVHFNARHTRHLCFSSHRTPAHPPLTPSSPPQESPSAHDHWQLVAADSPSDSPSDVWARDLMKSYVAPPPPPHARPSESSLQCCMYPNLHSNVAHTPTLTLRIVMQRLCNMQHLCMMQRVQGRLEPQLQQRRGPPPPLPCPCRRRVPQIVRERRRGRNGPASSGLWFRVWGVGFRV